MSHKKKEAPYEDSDSDDEDFEKRARLELAKRRKRFTGGIVFSSESESKEYSTSASLSASEKKGRKEVEDLERELDLKNTFSKETNRRDEDAEMNKYIDEQIRLRREAAKREREQYQNNNKDKDKTNLATTDSELSDIFSLPAEATDKIDDILLHSLSKNLASTSNEKSEAMLSSQMLNGIPEVDLGINERIRTIEMTEEAKLRMACSRPSKSSSSSSAPSNFSNNFKQHRIAQRRPVQNEVKTTTEAVVVVGEQPYEVEYRTGPRTHSQRGRASDDYYVAKFRRNNN